MNKLFTCLICLTVMLSTSCKTMIDFDMEILHPGYLKTQSGIKDVLLVDNAGKQPSLSGHKYYEYGVFKNDTVQVTDSLSTYILDFVSSYLTDEGYFNNINVAPSSWLRPTKTDSLDFLRPDALNNFQKKVLRDSIDTGYLISLDRLIVKTKMNKVRYDINMQFGTRDVIVNSVWRVIDAKQDTLCLLFQHNDSLFWEKWASGDKNPVSLIPDFKSTLPEIADYVALRVFRIFGPYWEKMQRSFYCNGSFRMNLAVDCIRDKNFDEAFALWKDEYEKGFGKSVYRAAMNIMIYYQYLDMPDEALLWAENAKLAIDKAIFYDVGDKFLLDSSFEYIRQRKLELSMLNVKNGDI